MVLVKDLDRAVHLVDVVMVVVVPAESEGGKVLGAHIRAVVVTERVGATSLLSKAVGALCVVVRLQVDVHRGRGQADDREELHSEVSVISKIVTRDLCKVRFESLNRERRWRRRKKGGGWCSPRAARRRKWR